MAAADPTRAGIGPRAPLKNLPKSFCPAGTPYCKPISGFKRKLHRQLPAGSNVLAPLFSMRP
jgi:hypothetical protein